MISPQRRYVLLPQDREIMALTGMDEKEYREFCKQCQDYSQIRPGTPVALGFIATVLIQLAIGALFTGISMLLAPKPKEETAPEIEESKIEGQDVVRRDRFTPKSGFDSVQNVVDMGSVVPIIYCKREGGLGGLRVNTNLLWSQLLSVGGGQFFKGIFLVGEAGPLLEMSQTALGNNTLASYELEPGANAGRISLYYQKDGGRLDSQDYQVGVRPDNDPGVQAASKDDIYTVLQRPDFCQAVLPSNQTEFGVYAVVGNNLGYKIGSDWLPLSQWQQRADTTRERQQSNERIANGRKQGVIYTTRAGFIGTEGDQLYRKGDKLEYRIYRSVQDLLFEESGATSGEEPPAEVEAQDVTTSIASKQRTFDERINVGDLYKIGSAVAICTYRSPEPFVSAEDFADDDGTTVEATFEIIQEGRVHTWPADRLEADDTDYPSDVDDGLGEEARVGRLGSETSHAFRLSVGAFSIERPAYVIEVGFRSNLQVASSGVANFNSLVAREYKNGQKLPSGTYQAYVDAEFCGGMDDGDSTDDDTYRKEITPGKYSASDTRYSFFRISYRNIDQQSFTELSNLYGIRSATGVNVYNYLRFRFTNNVRREFRFMPVTAWEIRSGEAQGDLYVMDPHVGNRFSIRDQGVVVEGNGEKVERAQETFQIKAFLNANTVTGNIASLEAGTLEGGTGYTDGVYTNQQLKLESGDMEGGKVFVDITVFEGVVSAVTLKPETFVVDFEGGEWLVLNDKDDDTDIGPGSGFRVQVATVTSTPVHIQLGMAVDDDPENFNYVDGWARLAEAFVYDAVRSSADGPEHSIAYVNVVTENDETPSYKDLAVVGLNIQSSQELTNLDQLSVYCTQGVIDSHLFPDVLFDLFTNKRYGTGEIFDKRQINEKSFRDAALWTKNRGYYFDGAVSNKANLRTWGTERARDFLLDLGVSGGKFLLKPALNFDGPEPIAALFTAGNIIDDTFQMTYLDTQERTEPIVSIKWRQERMQNKVGERGLFPQLREITVRREGVSDDNPTLQLDISGFATSQRHAIDRAKFECQLKKYITHVIRFKTLPSEATLQVGSVIKVGMESLRYEQPKNGVILQNGQVVTWPSMGDGEYPVLLWDGGVLQETTLKISRGRAEPRGAVFCLADTEQKAEAYKVQSVGFDEDGNVDVEAVYWPLDANDYSLLASTFGDNDFVITGRISE